MSNLLKRISAISLATVVTAAMAVSASAQTKTFSAVTLGNYVMSGRLDGTLNGGYASTWCNSSIYYIHAAVEGYVVTNEGEHVDAGRGEDTRHYDVMAYAYVGGHEDIGIYTGSYWSAHEIRDGVTGVGRYLAAIDV